MPVNECPGHYLCLWCGKVFYTDSRPEYKYENSTKMTGFMCFDCCVERQIGADGYYECGWCGDKFLDSKGLDIETYICKGCLPQFRGECPYSSSIVIHFGVPVNFSGKGTFIKAQDVKRGHVIKRGRSIFRVVDIHCDCEDGYYHNDYHYSCADVNGNNSVMGVAGEDEMVIVIGT